NFLFLPLSEVPPAPGQGALAIECREEEKSQNSELYQLLTKLNHERSARETQKEKEIFQQYGGSCHLPLGVYVKNIGDNDNYYLSIVKGEVDSKKISYQKISPQKEKIQIESPIFIGLPPTKAKNYNLQPHDRPRPLQFVFDEVINKCEIPVDCTDKIDGGFYNNIVVTSNYCLHALPADYDKRPWACLWARLWAAGIHTMFALFKKGHWVNGSASYDREEEMANFIGFNFKQQKNIKSLVLTSETAAAAATAAAGNSESLACYRHQIVDASGAVSATDRATYQENLLACKIFYWSSFSQYKIFCKLYPQIEIDHRQQQGNTLHCVGIGKTWRRFLAEKLPVNPFISIEHFINWING
ncbi:MAG: hypothetical protein HQK53_19190, partial [Oligoflexia bacterium]|nr:hypothetical protein [Oligoflexia bacterium]